MPRAVQVILGLSAAGTLRQAIHPHRDELLVTDDILSCGPLPPFQSLEAWARLRTAYWDSVAQDNDGRRFHDDLFANARALREVESITLWLGTGAAEQLVLPWMVQFLKLVESQAQIQVIQFTRYDSRNVEAWGLGLLHPDHFRDHPPPVALSAEAVVEQERLWNCVTSGEPAGLLSILADKSAHLFHSRAGLESLIYRYPDRRTGLGRWDFELLKKAKEKGPVVARVIGHTMGHNMGTDLVGDLYLFSRLAGLADSQLTCPLVTLSGDFGDLLTCDVNLTEAGESVLAGRANAVDLNGIDDWVLGVHLDSKSTPVWYQTEGTLICAS
jgi:hypothetical protein